MQESEKEYTEYFSKWRGTWIPFKDGFGNNRKVSGHEANELKKFKYKLR